MLRLSYRNKLRLKKLLRFCLVLLALSLVIGLVTLIYLDAYMVYDRDGATLSLSSQDAPPPQQVQGKPRPTVGDVEIIYAQDPVAEKTIADMGGYYITTAMLQNPQAVLDALKALNEPCAVMMEMKSIFGNFYYSTSIIGAPTADVDTDTIDQIITYLRENRFYMIGVVPAFRDRAFALNNLSCGLPISGGALWEDSSGCYWLDPADETVTSYLMQIARELGDLGFREVAFSEFLFPETNSIVYSSEHSKETVVSEAASTLTAFFQGSDTKISFLAKDLNFPAESCKGRLYFPDVDGSRVEQYAQTYGAKETVIELVFLANSRDTRFEGHAQLRPLLSES